MFPSVRFQATALAGVNKSGILKPDGNGYYEMVVGALNMFNSSGQYYVYEQARELFEKSGQFMRRVQAGSLRGEYGHPKPAPGQTSDGFARRVITIDEGNVACHFGDIWLDFDRIKDKDGKKAIAILAKVKPSGPKGAFLKESIENPQENVCFSIRALANEYMDGRITKRVLKKIVTFDYVNEPGMHIATKYNAPALESFEDKILTKSDFVRGLDPRLGVVTESASMNAQELFAAMGWSTPTGDRGWLKW